LLDAASAKGLAHGVDNSENSEDSNAMADALCALPLKAQFRSYDSFIAT
jgi:hypothetical protein